MMVGLVRGVVAAGLLAGCGAMQACAPRPPAPPPQVCADAGVLRQLDESVRARGRELALDVPPVGEVSTDASAPFPPMAHCSVRGHTVAYDTNRYGASPVYEPFLVRYSVEARHNGLFVRVE